MLSRQFTHSPEDNAAGNIHIEDFIANYPPQETPNIQQILSGKEEFIERRARGNWPVRLSDLIPDRVSSISFENLERAVENYNITARSQYFTIEELNLVVENGYVSRDELESKINIFNEILTSRIENVDRNGKQFFNHQESFHIYARASNYMALFDQTGTGKTCKIAGAAEFILDLQEQELTDEQSQLGMRVHRVIFLANRATLRQEIRRQLVCICSRRGKYETSKILEASDSKGRNKMITSILKDNGIEIHTYRSFTSKLAKTYPTSAHNGQIREDFKDVILWIDEIHHASISAKYFGPESTGRLNNLPRIRLDNVEYFMQPNIREKVRDYFMIWRLRHLISNVKAWASSATPITKDPSQIISIMNFVLPMERQMPHDFYSKDHERTDSDYRRHFAGAISMVRSSETGAREIDMGEELGLVKVGNKEFFSTTRINLLLMSPFQSEHYPKGNEATAGIFAAEFQASMFVFPDGHYGTGLSKESEESGKSKIKDSEAVQALNLSKVLGLVQSSSIHTAGLVTSQVNMLNGIAAARYIRYDPTTKRWTANPNELGFIENIRNIRRLATMSIIYATIIEKILEKPGNVFVFGSKVNGSGISLFDVILPYYTYQQSSYNPQTFRNENLQPLPFERFMGSKSVFQSITTSSTLAPYCSGKQDTKTRRLRDDFPKRPRYALITGYNTPIETANILEAFNSPENVNGEYIKAIFVAKIGQDGINIENVRQIHLIGGEWTEAEIYQSVSRALRVDSHQTLLKYLANEMRVKNIIGRPVVDVEVYKHACLYRDSNGNIQPAINYKVLARAESIDRENRKEFRRIKSYAFDCQLNYWRNYQPNDKDYSKECDYELCEFTCSDPSPVGPVDYSTYDVYYPDREIASVIQKILRYFLTHNSASINDMVKTFGNRKKIIIMALDRLISRRQKISGMYGNACYLREDHGNFFLDELYPVEPSMISDQYYTGNIIALSQENLQNISNVEQIRLDFQRHRDQFLQMYLDPNYFKVDKFVTSISWTTKEELLEESVSDLVRDQTTTSLNAQLLDYYKDFVIQVPDQPKEIEHLRQVQAEKPSSPELKIITQKVADLLPPNYIFETNQDTVILSYATVTDRNMVRYGLISDLLKIDVTLRIFRLKEKKWRDCDEIENIVFNKLLQYVLKCQILGRLELTQLPYLIKLPDGTDDIYLRIPSVRTDEREAKRGRVLSTINNIESLVDILVLANYVPSNQDVVRKIDTTMTEIENFFMYHNIELSPDTIVYPAQLKNAGVKFDNNKEIKKRLIYQNRLGENNLEIEVNLATNFPKYPALKYLKKWAKQSETATQGFDLPRDVMEALLSPEVYPYYLAFLKRMNKDIIIVKYFQNQKYSIAIIRDILINHLITHDRYHSFGYPTWILGFYEGAIGRYEEYLRQYYRV